MSIVLVSGALANKYLNGGEAWVRMSWLRGLQRLGFEVYFIEQIDPATCVDASGQRVPLERSANLAWFDEWTSNFGVQNMSALIYGDGVRVHGLSTQELLDAADAADLLINISGHLSYEPVLQRVRRRAYIDIDPGFTQFWHSSDAVDFHLDNHEYYFTIGENIGRPDCPIPTNGIQWRPIRQPVVLEDWPVCPDGAHDRFTTVASWRGTFGRVEFDGRTYGLKVHEFRKFIDVPLSAPGAFEIALDIHPAEQDDIRLLTERQWRLVDPACAVPDPVAFRKYVQSSGAEFSVAQGVYVDTASGWFSDRTVRYLASGKPALVQDTGFGNHYPVGAGLCAFRTLEEAVHGAEDILENYDRHSRAAREIAENYFSSDRVLSRLIDEVGITP